MFVAVETGFHSSEVPWNGVGERIEGAATASEALQLAGLDWEVNLQPLYVKQDNGFTKYHDRYAVTRGDSDDFFGIVSSQYRILQNTEAFSFFDGVVRRGEALYHSAGALFGGRIVFIIAKLPEDILVQDDVVEQYILLTNGHNGKQKVRMGYLPVDVQSQAMLHSALPSTKYNVAIRHMGISFNGRVAETRRALGLIKTWTGTSAESYIKMAETPVSSADVERYLGAIFPDVEGSDANRHIRTLIKETNNNFQGSKNSVWALFNDVVTYIDYASQVKKPSARINQIWFGTRARLKEKAAALAQKLIS